MEYTSVPVLPSIHPIRLRVTKQPFDSPDYIFELKHDGFRAIAYIEKRKCHLVSRNLNQFKFQTLQEALSTLPVKSAILDGEVVCFDDRGVSQFIQLLRRECDPAFYAFDLLWLNGKDYRGLPLVDRKARLEMAQPAYFLRFRNSSIALRISQETGTSSRRAILSSF